MSADIKVLRQWHHTRTPIQGIVNSDDMIPYMELNVDAEAIAHEATCLARSPKEYVSYCRVAMPKLIRQPKLDSRGSSVGTGRSTCRSSTFKNTDVR
jgi:hypothetical protein